MNIWIIGLLSLLINFVVRYLQKGKNFLPEITNTIISFGIIVLAMREGEVSPISVQLVLFLVLTLLLWGNPSIKSIKGSKKLISGAIVGLIVVEAMNISLLLPFNLVALSALLTLFYIALTQIVTKHFKGTLEVQIVLTQATIVILMTLLLIFTAKWSL